MDRTDERPERWWVLDPIGHLGSVAPRCGVCAAPLPTDMSIPMFEDKPLCAAHAGEKLSGTPMTAEYARWIEEGDPRWWSAWLCNCPYCAAEEVIA